MRFPYDAAASSRAYDEYIQAVNAAADARHVQMVPVVSLLNQPLDSLLTGRLAKRFLFELVPSLENCAPLSYRGRVLGAAKHALDKLVDWMRCLTACHDRQGDLNMESGNLILASQSFQDGLVIATRLAKTYPTNADCQSDIAQCHTKIGGVLMAQGRLREALEAFQASLAAAEPLAEADPSDLGRHHDVSDLHVRIGDVLMLQGDLPAALVSYKASRQVLDRIATTQPRNIDCQRDLATTHRKIGDVWRSQGNQSEALTEYRASYQLLEALTTSDPGSPKLQRDVSVSQNRIGDLLMTRGDSREALTLFRAACRTLSRLMSTDPHNGAWQRDLALTLNRVGDVLMAQQSFTEALKEFQTAHGILQLLSSAEPANLPAPLSAFQTDKTGNPFSTAAKRPHVSPSELGHASWQRDLSASYCRIGDVLMAQGQPNEALSAFREAQAIAQRLITTADLSITYKKIGEVLTAQGDLQGAHGMLQNSLGIAERWAAADPSNAEWQADLAHCYRHLAIHGTSTSDAGAGHYWRRCREVLRQMRANGMFLEPPLAKLLEQLEDGTFV
jgi:tetratricopeptide (TPR) repeat protein